MRICISPWEEEKSIQFVNEVVWQQCGVSFLCVGQQGTYRNLGEKNSILWEGKQRRGEKKNQSCGGVVGLFLLLGFGFFLLAVSLAVAMT